MRELSGITSSMDDSNSTQRRLSWMIALILAIRARALFIHGFVSRSVHGIRGLEAMVGFSI
jgi:hypothetical protein